ncbi:hypothetical protein B0T16DRAFT_167031 [Cercophora newfieldiana]|uniref:Uncharacterized protein n=1 Tax=Cercophora newfieldiana TaxID=92897 RepID=A0AA39Y5Y1_9PEZI|nr:hypothetical protein B0T16DRAFT_167031 [Cercophora newfieldiana]
MMTGGLHVPTLSQQQMFARHWGSSRLMPLRPARTTILEVDPQLGLTVLFSFDARPLWNLDESIPPDRRFVESVVLRLCLDLQGGISRQSALCCRRVSAGSTGPGPSLVVFRLLPPNPPPHRCIVWRGQRKGTKIRKIALSLRGALGDLGQGSGCACLPHSPWTRLLAPRGPCGRIFSLASPIEKSHSQSLPRSTLLLSSSLAPEPPSEPSRCWKVAERRRGESLTGSRHIRP